MIIRPGTAADAPAFCRVKAQLRMLEQSGSTQRGGFLLGTDESRYRYFLEHEMVMVAEDPEIGIVGFSIIVGDQTLRQSEMWEKKDQVDWTGFPTTVFDRVKVCYYEQLAMLPDPRFRTYAKNLALMNLLQAFRQHDLMFTAVVTHPVRNLASLPFLKSVGFRCVGAIDEHYPEYGDLVSDVYLLAKTDFQTLLNGPLGPVAQKIAGHALEPFL